MAHTVVRTNTISQVLETYPCRGSFCAPSFGIAFALKIPQKIDPIPPATRADTRFVMGAITDTTESRAL